MSELYTKIVPELGGLDPLIWKMEDEKVWKYVLRLIEESNGRDFFKFAERFNYGITVVILYYGITDLNPW